MRIIAPCSGERCRVGRREPSNPSEKLIHNSELERQTLNELQELLDFATDAARQAGRITLGHFKSGIAVETKAEDAPVTIADKNAELKLREMIKVR